MLLAHGTHRHTRANTFFGYHRGLRLLTDFQNEKRRPAESDFGLFAHTNSRTPILLPQPSPSMEEEHKGRVGECRPAMSPFAAPRRQFLGRPAALKALEGFRPWQRDFANRAGKITVRTAFCAKLCGFCGEFGVPGGSGCLKWVH
jgi:hypothetical protein